MLPEPQPWTAPSERGRNYTPPEGSVLRPAGASCGKRMIARSVPAPANHHRGSYTSPALAAASYPFVDLPSENILQLQAVLVQQVYKIILYLPGLIEYNENNDKSEFGREWNMNKEWSELNKTMQAQIKKKDTYKMGIDTLFSLRNQLMQTLVSFKEELCREDFNAIPFINADGYHSKTIAYSIWHIFRIEDIVAHTVINEDEQVFFAGNYQERINSPIITTGNELVKQQIADFSKQLNLEELYSYIFEVRESTEKMLERFSYDELKRKIPDGRKGHLESLNVVNGDEKAIWLIDYWCSKDIRGLIQMPFSRHWIMHTEACLRIKNKMHS